MGVLVVSTIPNVVSSVLLALGCLVLASNFWAIYASARNRRLGINKHVSTVPIVTQILVVLAAMASRHTEQPWVPGWVFWLIAVADPFLWQSAILLFNRVFLRPRLR